MDIKEGIQTGQRGAWKDIGKEGDCGQIWGSK